MKLLKFYLMFIFISISVCTISCKKDKTEISTPATTAKTLVNISYGAHPLQKLDVYLPENRNSNTNVVIFIHGGSFIEGDKDDYSSQVKELMKNGFAVINMNYRLIDATGLFDNPVKHLESAVKIKDQVNDVGIVVDYVLSQAKEWQISETKLALAGHSAGATLALLYSYDARNTNKVKAVANLAGALDQTSSEIPDFLLQLLLPSYVLEAGYRYTGFPIAAANDVHYKAISPLYVANANRKIPTLTIFPEFNAVGDLPKQDRATFDAFTAKLNSLAIPNKFVQIAGANHEFENKFGLVLTEVVNYFNSNLR
jgi:acetyl esterase/lipase